LLTAVTSPGCGAPRSSCSRFPRTEMVVSGTGPRRVTARPTKGGRSPPPAPATPAPPPLLPRQAVFSSHRLTPPRSSRRSPQQQAAAPARSAAPHLRPGQVLPPQYARCQKKLRRKQFGIVVVPASGRGPPARKPRRPTLGPLMQHRQQPARAAPTPAAPANSPASTTEKPQSAARISRQAPSSRKAECSPSRRSMAGVASTNRAPRGGAPSPGTTQAGPSGIDGRTRSANSESTSQSRPAAVARSFRKQLHHRPSRPGRVAAVSSGPAPDPAAVTAQRAVATGQPEKTRCGPGSPRPYRETRAGPVTQPRLADPGPQQHPSFPLREAPSTGEPSRPPETGRTGARGTRHGTRPDRGRAASTDPATQSGPRHGPTGQITRHDASRRTSSAIRFHVPMVTPFPAHAKPASFPIRLKDGSPKTGTRRSRQNHPDCATTAHPEPDGEGCLQQTTPQAEWTMCQHKSLGAQEWPAPGSSRRKGSWQISTGQGWGRAGCCQFG